MRVVVLTGAPGVGKTTVARALLGHCPSRSAWIDTDRLAAVEPWKVDDRLCDLIGANLAACLANYHVYGAPVVVVSGVVVQSGVYERLRPLLSDGRFTFVLYALTATEDILSQRIVTDPSGQEPTQRLQWLHLNEDVLRVPGVTPIDTTTRTAGDVAMAIATREGLTTGRASHVSPRGRVVAVDVEEAHALAGRALEQAGVPARACAVVAKSLVDSELDGYPSHGLLRIPEYVLAIRRGEIDPRSSPRIESASEAASVVHGNRSLGTLALSAVRDELCARLRGEPLVAVSLLDSSHVGRLAPLARAVAEEGHCLLGFVNYLGAGRKVAPCHGADGRLATNPLVFGFPSSEPVVVDMTTSAISEGTVRARLQRDGVIPEGWLVDRAGLPTTDARALYTDPPRAWLAPLGGDRHGHKGFALALMVDIVAGAIAGAGCARAAAQTGGNGGLFIGLRTDLCGRRAEEVTRDVDALVEFLLRTTVKGGRPPVRIPGHVRARQHEILIAEETYEEILALGRDVRPPARVG